jgi:hypothetical protein
VAPKGGRLRSWNASHDLKRLFMRFDLLCSSMLVTSTSAQSKLSRLVLPIPFYLLLPPVFLRLDWFPWFFHRLDAKPLFKIKVFLALLDWIFCYTLFHGFDTMGSHLRGEGSLDYDRGLVRLQVQMNFDTTINRQQAPFSGTVAGEQVIKIQYSIAFVNIFSFSLDFSFASLNFHHPQNKKKINLGFC